MHINLHLLRVFHAVAEQKSFSRAAAALSVSQPAVSKGVRELERQLDLPLLERGGVGAKGFKLTADGAALFDHARGIFALAGVAADDIRARAGLNRGRLGIGASTTIAGYWLPPYVAEFSSRFPAIDVRVGVGNTQAIGSALVDCEYDAALVEGAVIDSRIRSNLWRNDQLRIVAPPDSPLARRRKLAADVLNDEVWLVREPGSGTRDFTSQQLAQHGIAPLRTIEIGSNEGIARAVAAGLGIAMLPAKVVQELIALRAVAALNFPAGAALIRPLYLLALKERPVDPRMRALLSVLDQPLEPSRT